MRRSPDQVRGCPVGSVHGHSADLFGRVRMSERFFRHNQPAADRVLSWIDPEYEKFFHDLGCRCERRDSFYTSVHFVVRPRQDSPLSCEIQVRTLFEEIWGEIDHSLNYPHPTTIASCQEQLRVLAKLVGAGSRLVTSIYNCSS